MPVVLLDNISTLQSDVRAGNQHPLRNGWGHEGMGSGGWGAVG